MSKLELDRNGNKVQISEIANIGGKEQLVFGDYDRDLILRTKGTITVQVQNKFFDLLNSKGESINTGGFKPIYVIDINSQSTYPEESLIIDISTNKLYSFYNGTLLDLSVTSSNSGFVSYLNVQNLDPTQKLRAISNLGIYWNGLDATPFYEGQFIFNGISNSHQLYKDGKLEDLYLSLLTGGTVNGKVNLLKGLNATSYWNLPLLKPNDEFEGFVLKDLLDPRMAIYNSETQSVIQTFGGKDILFKINNISNTEFIEVMRTTSEGLIVGSGEAKGNTSATFNETVFIEELGIGTSIKSFEYSRDLDLFINPGFQIYNEESDYLESKLWTLEVDKIKEKHPDSIYGITHNNWFNYIDRSYDIKSIDEFELELHDYTGLEENDLLLALNYNWDGNILSYAYVKLISPVNYSDGVYWEIETTGLSDTKSYQKLIKVGNTSKVIKSILTDFQTNNLKIVKGVSSIDNLFLNGKPDLDIFETYKNLPKYPTVNIETAIGDLKEVIDSDLHLNNNDEYGLYSNNAYIKGEADLSYLKLGDKLLYKNNILTIADLEILKNRRVDGANGLTGGGKLIDADIVISHTLGSWVNKINLGTNNFISNLVVDQYGHITDWATRAVTTTDIPEGSNLYYTDDRVKALFPNYTLLTGITSTNINNWNTGYDNSLTNVTFNSTSGVLTFVRPSSNLTVTIPIGGTANLSLGTLTDTTMPILNSAGTGVTLVAATDTTAGLITADTTTTQELAGNKSLSGILTLKQAPLLSYSELRMLGPNNYIRTNNLSNMSINANSGIFFQIAGSTTASIFADYLKIDKYIKMTGPTGWQGGIMFETSPGVAAGTILANGPNDLTIRPGETNGILTVGYDYNNNKLRLVGPTYLMAQVGSGTRMVTVAADGLISSQAIPTGGSWGAITGNINTQTDLIALLNTKENTFTKGSLVQGTGVIISDGVGRLVGNNTTISIASATMLTLGGVKLWSNSIQTDPAQGIVSMANRTYGVQLNNDGQAVVNVPWIEGGGGGGTWGYITGTLSSQSDLQTALNGKENAFNKGSLVAGTGLSVVNGTGRLVGSDNLTIGLTSATMYTIGGIKLLGGAIQTEPSQGTTSVSGRTYGIQLNSDGQAVVNVPWIGGTGGGTVNSVAMTVPTGLTVTGSPITTSGTLAVNLQSGYSIPTIASQTSWDNKENAFSKGDIIPGSGVTITGTLTGRLVGGGNITINATGGGGSQNLQQTTTIGNSTDKGLIIQPGPDLKGTFGSGVIYNRLGSTFISNQTYDDSSDGTTTLQLSFGNSYIDTPLSGISASVNEHLITLRDKKTFYTNEVSNPVGSTTNISINLNADKGDIFSHLGFTGSGILTIEAPTNFYTAAGRSDKFIIRLRTGSTRTLSWNSVYRGIGITLPTSLPANKLLYVGCVRNYTDSRWDVIALQIES